MKVLIVEDDFASTVLLKKLLGPYFDCDAEEEGREAVELFQKALDRNEPYDLICLDIIMPEMDGHACLRAFRQIEAEKEITRADGVKVIMTSALSDSTNVATAFDNQCEAYLIKPIEKNMLLDQIRALGLLDAQ